MVDGVPTWFAAPYGMMLGVFAEVINVLFPAKTGKKRVARINNKKKETRISSFQFEDLFLKSIFANHLPFSYQFRWFLDDPINEVKFRVIVNVSV